MLAAYENNASLTKRYSVSDDGCTWTEQADFSATARLRGACAIGDGYVYCGTGTAINRYDTSGTLVGTFKSGLKNIYQIVSTPDRVWFYTLNNDWSAATAIMRYRISDASIGGSANISGPLNIRYMMFGRDGLLYFGTRGSNTTDDSTGVSDAARGGFVYDTSFAAPQQLVRYIEPGYKNGAAIFPDLENGKVFIWLGGTRYEYDAWNPAHKKTLGGGSNIFCGMNIGDLHFVGDYGNNGRVQLLGDDRVPVAVASLGTALVGISDITAASSTGTQLPNITAVWYMNETSGASLCNGAAIDGAPAISLEGDFAVGANGVAHKGLVLRPGAHGTVASSDALVPATGDFTISVWAYLPQVAAGRAIFSNGSASIGVDASGRFAFACGGVSAVSQTAVTDGGWHLLTAVRRAGAVEAWVDGVKAGGAALAASAAVAQTSDWMLGCNPDGTGGLAGGVLDELRVYPVALPADDISYLFGLPLPRPGAVTPDTSAASAFGTVVAYADPVAGDAAAPSLAVASDGTCYLATGAKVYKSSDRGSTWSLAASDTGLNNVSLFASGSGVYGLGTAAGTTDGTLRFTAMSGGGAAWSCESLGDSVKAPGLAPTTPVVSGGRAWLGAVLDGRPDETALLSFSFSNGSAGDPALASAVTNNPPQFYGSFVSAVAVAAPSGDVHVFASATNAAAWKKYPEVGGIATNTSAGFGFKCFSSFPGAAKPLTVAYDAAGGRYWAVSLPEHVKTRDNSSLPQFDAATIGVYSSSDLGDWRHHGDIVAADRSAVRFSRPSIAFAGDDMIVAFAAAVDDGAFGPAGLDHPNFVIARKVAGFRALATGLEAPERGLLVAEETARRVMRYVYEEETGDWLPAGVFAEGTYGGRAITQPDTVLVHGNRVYVANSHMQPLGTFVFDRNGRHLDFYENNNPDALCIVGDWLYSSKWFSSDMFRTNLKTGETEPWALSGASVSAVRSMVALPDGTIAMASRSTHKVEQFAVDGTWVKTLIYNEDDATWQTVTYDATNNVLWAATHNKKYLGRYDFATGEAMLYNTDWTGAFDLKMYDGRLLADVYSPGRIHELKFDGSNIYNIAVIGGTCAFGRFDVFEMPRNPGFTILMR